MLYIIILSYELLYSMCRNNMLLSRYLSLERSMSIASIYRHTVYLCALFLDIIYYNSMYIYIYIYISKQLCPYYIYSRYMLLCMAMGIENSIIPLTLSSNRYQHISRRNNNIRSPFK